MEDVYFFNLLVNQLYVMVEIIVYFEVYRYIL